MIAEFTKPKFFTSGFVMLTDIKLGKDIDSIISDQPFLFAQDLYMSYIT